MTALHIILPGLNARNENDVFNECFNFTSLRLNDVTLRPLLAPPLLPNKETVRELVVEIIGKATAPEFQPPACCAFPAVWLWSGTWLTPTRGDLDGHVTERSWLGKGEWVISRARSIN